MSDILAALEELIGSAWKPGEERTLLIDSTHLVMIDTARSAVLRALSRLVFHENDVPHNCRSIFTLVQGNDNAKRVTVSVDHLRAVFELLYRLDVHSVDLHVRDAFPLVIVGKTTRYDHEDEVRIALAPKSEKSKEDDHHE